MYVDFELSYDSFHTNAEHIYRTTTTQYQNGRTAVLASYPFKNVATSGSIPGGEAALKTFGLGNPGRPAGANHPSKRGLSESRSGGELEGEIVYYGQLKQEAGWTGLQAQSRY